MRTRDRIHRAMRAAGERGRRALPQCALIELPDFDCSLLCDALAEEFDAPTEDPAMPPPDVVESLAKGCTNGCGVTCGDRPCAGCMQGAPCDSMECRCHENDSDESRYEPEGDEE